MGEHFHPRVRPPTLTPLASSGRAATVVLDEGLKLRFLGSSDTLLSFNAESQLGPKSCFRACIFWRYNPDVGSRPSGDLTGELSSSDHSRIFGGVVAAKPVWTLGRVANSVCAGGIGCILRCGVASGVEG